MEENKSIIDYLKNNSLLEILKQSEPWWTAEDDFPELFKKYGYWGSTSMSDFWVWNSNIEKAPIRDILVMLFYINFYDKKQWGSFERSSSKRADEMKKIVWILMQMQDPESRFNTDDDFAKLIFSVEAIGMHTISLEELYNQRFPKT